MEMRNGTDTLLINLAARECITVECGVISLPESGRDAALTRREGGWDESEPNHSESRHPDLPPTSSSAGTTSPAACGPGRSASGFVA